MKKSGSGHRAMDEPFQPQTLREYALLADGHRGALVGPHGDVAWMCAPSWADDAVFSSLMGGRSGFAVTPTDGRHVWGGYYEPGSLVWHSRWVTSTGIIECEEALALPADPHRTVLLRRLRAVDGDASLRVWLDAGAHFGADPMTDIASRDGAWSLRTGPLRVRLAGLPDAAAHGAGGLSHHLAVPQGQHHDLVLEISDRDLPGSPPAPEQAWEATRSTWARSVPRFDDTLTPDDSRQSYAVLRGLTVPGGGMVAAATTALPERADTGRAYDYRYVWIRDQCYVAQAVAACGPYPLLDDAVRFVSARILEHGPDLSPAYTVHAEELPEEQRVGLPGYPGGSDRVGNWVRDQFQLDAWGEALLMLAAAARHDRLDRDAREAASVAAQTIRERWREPDAGVWEIEPRRWTHSRLIAAAGLVDLAAAAPSIAPDWAPPLADALLDDASTDCLHPSGRWQRAPEDPRVDASLLRPLLRGRFDVDDPRWRLTVQAITTELAEDGYVYRFRQDDRPLGEAEGAFLLCGFDLAMALHRQGDPVSAARWFERGRAACGTTGLLTEEYDVAQRQLRGNLPQAFVHGGLLEAARRLADEPTGHVSG